MANSVGLIKGEGAVQKKLRAFFKFFCSQNIVIFKIKDCHFQPIEETGARSKLNLFKHLKNFAKYKLKICNTNQSLYQSVFLFHSLKKVRETGARSNTFFSFCYFSRNKCCFSKFFFNMKNLDHYLTNIQKINK